MPDQPLPPQNPETSPPPVPTSPAVNLPVPDSEDALKSLSPFELMNKRKQPAPPVAPSAPPPPTREQLIEQAAKGPATPFILPTKPTAPPVEVAPLAQKPTAPPPVQPTPQPTRVLPITGRPAPLIQNTVVAPTSSPNKKGKTIAMSIAGLVVILILAAGGAYVLASSGARVPVLYTYISGLSSNGATVAQNSAAALASFTSYQQHGEINLKAKNSDGSDVLPSDMGSADPIASIVTKVTANTPLQFSFQGRKITGKEGITIDNLTEVPVYLNAEENGDWNLNLPANVVQSFVQVPASSVKKTLLYPSIQPIPLDVILSAAKKETGYQKVSGQKAAEYTYSLDTDILKEWLPTEATIQDPVGKIVYEWKSGAPLAAKITGIVSYQDRTYQFTENFEYTNWNQSIDTTDTHLSALLNGTVKPEIDTAVTFIPQLGATFDRIPNTIAGSSLLDNSGPVTPSGQSVALVTDAITTIPPLPKEPATEEEINRDTQRQTDLTDLQNVLQKYKLRQGQYPPTNGLVQVQASPILFKALVGDYLTAMPVDPLKDTYWYEYQSDGRAYTLRSAAENTSNAQAKAGKAFSYFEFTGK